MALDLRCELRNMGDMETNLAKLLETRGMRLSDLARKMGVDKGTVTRWAQKAVPLSRVFAIERETGIKREELRPDFFGEKT